MADAPAGTALLVVDVQNGQIERPVAAAGRLLDTISGLVARARSSGMPIVFVQHDGAKGELFTTAEAPGPM